MHKPSFPNASISWGNCGNSIFGTFHIWVHCSKDGMFFPKMENMISIIGMYFQKWSRLHGDCGLSVQLTMPIFFQFGLQFLTCPASLGLIYVSFYSVWPQRLKTFKMCILTISENPGQPSPCGNFIEFYYTPCKPS